jgi:hypothetical protein
MDLANPFDKWVWQIHLTNPFSGRNKHRNKENTETRTQHHKIKEHKIKDKLDNTITSTKLRERPVTNKFGVVPNFQ